MHDRPRRLRKSQAMRELVAETRIHASNLIQPHFVVADDKANVPIDALPGIHRHGIEPLLKQIESDLDLGIHNVLLFGVVDTKDAHGTAGHDSNSPVQRAVRAVKKRFGEDIHLITDVCLCTYTDHGHCGIVEGQNVLNDESLRCLPSRRCRSRKQGPTWLHQAT